MCEEKKEALEYQALHGINPEQKKGVTFLGQSITIHDVLENLVAVEELTCDEDLEILIHETRQQKGFLPSLKVLNGVSIQVKDLAERQKQQKVRTLMEKLSRYANSYSVGNNSVPVWFIQDEVGSAIQHSDKPNVEVTAFMYSPNNSPTDANAISYNIMWPNCDIKANEAIYRDYLSGFSEASFRSARLHSWFNTPESFYKEALSNLR
jgi:hypothetical protein